MTDQISRAGPPHPVVWHRDARRDARQERHGAPQRFPDARLSGPPAPDTDRPDADPNADITHGPMGATPVSVDWSDALAREREATSTHGRADHARAAGAYERLTTDSAAAAGGVSVHGIPAAEMTPAVRRTLSRLSGEIDRLRHEMEARGLDADTLPDPRERADHLPLLGARALERILGQRLDGWVAGDPAPAVAFFYMANFEAVRGRHGLAAAEAAYHHMAAALAAERHDGEDIGAPGGAGVVMLTPFTGQVDALWTRARTLARQATDPVVWGRETLRISLLIGLHLPRRGERAADALWQAERAARRMV